MPNRVRTVPFDLFFLFAFGFAFRLSQVASGDTLLGFRRLAAFQ
jgi:hypothetical protein